jgi:hypothetical protein
MPSPCRAHDRTRWLVHHDHYLSTIVRARARTLAGYISPLSVARHPWPLPIKVPSKLSPCSQKMQRATIGGDTTFSWAARREGSRVTWRRCRLFARDRLAFLGPIADYRGLCLVWCVRVEMEEDTVVPLQTGQDWAQTMANIQEDVKRSDMMTWRVVTDNLTPKGQCRNLVHEIFTDK